MADEFLTDLEALAERPLQPATVGGKAANLARLMAAGARVPAGFVIRADALSAALGPDATRPIADLERAVEAAARRLRAPLVIRSSASIEDSSTGAAPGIFLSLRDVFAGTTLAKAIRAVWASARTPAAAAYLEARGLDESSLSMAVIVQEQIRGTASGVAYTRVPGRPQGDTALVEVIASDSHANAAAGRATREGPRPAAELRRDDCAVVSADAELPLDADQLAAIGQAALAAERAIDASSGADVEWVLETREIWVVQARPLPLAAHAAGDRAPPRALFEFSRENPEVVWRWDATHNPEPLSPAQTGLVRHVDAAKLAPFRMRVVAGFLYAADPPGRVDQPICLRAADLRARFASEIHPAIERALAKAEAEPVPSLGLALAAYDDVYRAYASTLAPLLSSAKRALPELLAEELPDERSDATAGELLAGRPMSQIDRLVASVAAGDVPFETLLQTAGALCSVWDVAEPTFAEAPEALRRAVARYRGPAGGRGAAEVHARVRAGLPARAVQRFDDALELGRAAREIGEVDDFLFGRAQGAVRRALLGLADSWSLRDRSDVFYAPFEHIVEAARAELDPDPDELHALADEGRRTQRAQRELAMPLAIQNGLPLTGTGKGLGLDDCWQGRGIGGRAQGTVVRADDFGSGDDLGPDAVLVAQTVTPAMALTVTGVSCIVTEHGGLLDHGAALARELGIPCVVGCAGVWTNLGTGDRVWVDGQAGVVARIRLGA